MTLEIRKFLWVILLAVLPGIVGAQSWNSYYFPSKSSTLLEGVINHVIHSPLPPPQLDPRFSEDLPCLFYGKEMLGNYLYILKEKNFTVSEVSDQELDGKKGFMHNFEMLQLKCYLLKTQLGLDSTNKLPTILSAIKSSEETSNFKSFKDHFLFQYTRKLSAADEALVEEIYQLVKPFKSRSRVSQSSKLAAFAPIILTEREEENEFCKLTEQVALVFQSMEYPKINWELRINVTQNCSCSYSTDQEPSFMSSRISSPVASTFRTSSPSNFVFIQTGDPEIHIREVACCTTNSESHQSWPSRSDSLNSGMGLP